jgi:hypothetical protein
MTIDPFTERGAFGPEATAAMGEAFDAACEKLRSTSLNFHGPEFT